MVKHPIKCYAKCHISGSNGLGKAFAAHAQREQGIVVRWKEVPPILRRILFVEAKDRVIEENKTLPTRLSKQ